VDVDTAANLLTVAGTLQHSMWDDARGPPAPAASAWQPGMNPADEMAALFRNLLSGSHETLDSLSPQQNLVIELCSKRAALNDGDDRHAAELDALLQQQQPKLDLNTLLSQSGWSAR
jgi:hypothetical protein